MKKKAEEVLERKIKAYSLIIAWLDHEYPNCSDNNVIQEYQEQSIRLSAQIKLLRFLLDE